MPTFKNITIKMKGGGSRKQRVKVLKSGKFRFVKNLTKSKSKRTKKTTPKRSRRTMAKKKKSRKGGGKNLQATMFKFIRMGALVGPAAIAVLTPGRSAEQKGKDLLWQFTGWNYDENKFQPEGLLKGYAPYLAAVAATYGIPKIGAIIRRL